jgi:hypothetical protein
MEIFFDILAEIIFQGLGEALFDWLLRSKSPAVRALGASILSGFAGLVLGCLSLLVFRAHLIGSYELRLAFFLFLPVLNGWIMSRIGRSFERCDRPRSLFEYFVPAFFFSLCFGMVRLLGSR